MEDFLTKSLRRLKDALPELEHRRFEHAFANDVYEAVDYWVKLGRWVLDSNTAVDFRARAAGEVILLNELRSILPSKVAGDRTSYHVLFDAAEDLLAAVALVEPAPDGHMGFLLIAKTMFCFLEDSFGFKVVGQSPTELRLSSGKVFLNLEWSVNPTISCEFGPEKTPRMRFGIDDLLFLYGDQKYRSLPDRLKLESQKDVEEWFKFIADCLKLYGQDMLANRDGIFQELEAAQTQRDIEHSEVMERLWSAGERRDV